MGSFFRSKVATEHLSWWRTRPAVTPGDGNMYRRTPRVSSKWSSSSPKLLEDLRSLIPQLCSIAGVKLEPEVSPMLVLTSVLCKWGGDPPRLRAPASRPWVGSQALLDSCNARTEIYKCKCMTPKCSPSYHCKNQTWQRIVRFVFQVSLRWQVNRSQSSSSGLSSLRPSVLLSAIHGETRHWYLTKLEPKAYRDTMQVLILYILIYMQICPVTILNTCFWLL